MRIDTILFDLDGTLHNREVSLRSFANAQFDTYKRLIGVDKQTYVNRFISLDAQGYATKEKVYTRLESEHMIADASRFINDYYAAFHEYCISFDGVIDTLKELKKMEYKLGIVTNGKEKGQRATIETLGLTDLVDTIVISEVEGCKKPDSKLFMIALDRCQTTPEKAVYMGDHPLNDMEAAKAVGMKTIWKKNPWFILSKAADETIEHFSELIEMMIILEYVSN